jgi:hypothetical protein
MQDVRGGAAAGNEKAQGFKRKGREICVGEG